MEKLPRISYQVTVSDTGETSRTHVVDDVTVMVDHLLHNKTLAEVAYNNKLLVEVEVGSVVDTLSLLFFWVDTGKQYMRVTATKLPTPA